MTSRQQTDDHGIKSVGFFGGGLMAEAIIQGLLQENVVPPDKITVSDPSADRRAVMDKLGVTTTTKPSDMLRNSRIVFIAVKPDIVPYIQSDIRDHESKTFDQSLYISIAAGLSLQTLLDGNPDRRMARVMPNQPCLVGEGASGFSLSSACTDADRSAVLKLLAACGLAVEVPESKLNAVTGVSGSGPAYVFMMIEAMADAGVQLGLPRDTARRLAAQTALGAAKMVLEEPDVHPAEFRNRVESPGGATIAASRALEQAGFRAAVYDAVSAAHDKSVELGRPGGK